MCTPATPASKLVKVGVNYEYSPRDLLDECDNINTGKRTWVYLGSVVGGANVDEVQKKVVIKLSQGYPTYTIPVSHENILQVLYMDTVDQVQRMVFAKADLNLGTLLAFALAANATLTEQELQMIFSQIISGLDELHRCGQVLTNLQPSNILLFKRKGGGWTVKIDASCAKCWSNISAYSAPMEDWWAHSIYFAPEEIFVASSHYFHVEKICLWRLGYMLYQAIVGIIPSRFQNYNVTIPDHVRASQELRILVASLMQTPTNHTLPSISDLTKNTWISTPNFTSSDKPVYIISVASRAWNALTSMSGYFFISPEHRKINWLALTDRLTAVGLLPKNAETNNVLKSVLCPMGRDGMEAATWTTFRESLLIFGQFYLPQAVLPTIDIGTSWWHGDISFCSSVEQRISFMRKYHPQGTLFLARHSSSVNGGLVVSYQNPDAEIQKYRVRDIPIISPLGISATFSTVSDLAGYLITTEGWVPCGHITAPNTPYTL